MFYTYDVLGQRIAKKVDGTTTRFAWRSGHVIFDVTGSDTVSYTWGKATDDLVAIHDHDSGNHYYVVQDALRSVRGIVQRDGTWKAAWRYELYGAAKDSSGSVPFTLRFRWAGAQFDAETGFYHMRARYYDPKFGRFMQEDPAGRSGGANLYAYASGDPSKKRDPWGTTALYDEQYEFQVPAWDNGMMGPGGWDLVDGGFGLLLGGIMGELWAWQQSTIDHHNWIRRERYTWETSGRPIPTGHGDIDAMCGDGGCSGVKLVEGDAKGGLSCNVFTRDRVQCNRQVDINVAYDRSVLAHELVHVSQWREWGGFTYWLKAIGAWARFLPSFDTDAVYQWSPGGTWGSYNMEQQAQVVRDCVYRSDVVACGLSPWH